MKPDALKPSNSGVLFVVATPIGNLGDLSPRAREVISSADIICAEDTRSVAKLLGGALASGRLLSYHDHNEQQRTPQIIEELSRGAKVALISEAGTPCVSDPGYRLIKAAREQRLKVQGIPGPSAALTALSISGLPSDRFTFIGFLPQKEGRKRKVLEEIRTADHTYIAYESPHRVLKTLKLFEELLPEARILFARELTKLHEESLSGSASELLRELESRQAIKGEIVLVISARQLQASPQAGENESEET